MERYQLQDDSSTISDSSVQGQHMTTETHHVVVTRQIPATSVITWTLIAANVAMYAVTMLTGGHASPIFNSLKLIPANLGVSNCWTLVTSMFLHSDLGHLTANMYSLYVLGSMCEHMFGRGKYLLTYFGGGIAGGLMFVLLRQGSLTGVVGASGAIFALMGLYGAFLLILRKKVGTGNANATAVIEQAIRNFAIILAINAVMVPLMGNIAWEGHLGGLLFGFLVGLPMVPSLPATSQADGNASQAQPPRQR